MSSEENFEIKLITDSEHHFNDLCFKIRALASTWLLATFAGIGFIATNTVDTDISKLILITVLCFASAIGITVLWVLDLLIYQQLLNCWFQCRNLLAHKSKLSKLVYEKISTSQPRQRATTRLKIYYHVTASAPIVCSILLNIPETIQCNMTAIISMAAATLLMIVINILIYTKTPTDSPEPTEAEA